MESFAELLRKQREKAGLSQRGLARSSRINPAIISRMESGDRGPSGPEQVMAIGSALGLDEGEVDALLASAGFWPLSILRLGPGDETLRLVARVLAGASSTSRSRFRSVIKLLAEEWESQ